MGSSDDESSVYSGLKDNEESDSDGSSIYKEESDSEKPSATDDIDVNDDVVEKSGVEIEKNHEESDISDDECESNEEDDDESDRKSVEFDKYDSSDEEDLRNSIGNIPVLWYKDYDHIGYNLDGKRIRKPAQKTEIEEFLSKMEDPNYWKTVKDKQTGKDIVLSDEALATINNVMIGKHPKIGYNPYEPFLDLYSHEVMIHPVTNRPEHKRSFIPSKLEKKQVSRMLHAIKMGWIKPRKPKEDKEKEGEKFYDLWDSEQGPMSKSQMARLKMHIPAPKMKLPGHIESYNPPPEYIFTKEEEEKWRQTEPEDRKLDFIPEKYSCLRHVPAYANFIRERHERCMDLYLAPRQRKMRLNVDPNDLLPKLPKPQDLQPFPSTMALVYKGHTSLVRAISVEPFGQYFASGSDDGTIRIWEIHTGRCMQIIKIDGVVHSLAWCPNAKLTLLAASVGSNVYLINTGVGDRLITSDTDLLLKSLCSSNSSVFENSNDHVRWTICHDKQYESGLRICLSHRKEVKQVVWHAKGDFFATVCPEGGNSSVFVHHLSKLKSQSPFTKNKGLVQKVMFHPTRPYFFVANQRHIRVYNLVKQQLTKKLMSNCKFISSIALHPKGDNLLVGSYDCRSDWFDLDLSAKPYKTLRKVQNEISLILVAQCCIAHSKDMVPTCDLLQNPLIVPVKILRGHQVRDNLGVMDCAFHPIQPWILSCGSDSTIRLYV